MRLVTTRMPGPAFPEGMAPGAKADRLRPGAECQTFDYTTVKLVLVNASDVARVANRVATAAPLPSES